MVRCELGREQGPHPVRENRAPREEHASRLVPIFPELRPYLEEAWEQAPAGTEYVITRYRDTNVTLRTQLLRIIAKAGLKPWPKLFQNLRSTRETELQRSHPAHVVCAWIGNSLKVAAKHYLQVTEEDFTRALTPPLSEAVQKAVQQGLASQSEVLAKPLKYEPLRSLAPPPSSGGRTRTYDTRIMIAKNGSTWGALRGLS
jgi:hypothetical protein